MLDSAAMQRLGCLLAGISLLLALASCQASSQIPPAVPQSSRPSVAALGRLEPRDRVIDISVAGDERLARVLVKQGQVVKAGDVLAYLETYDTRVAARDRANALLQDAEEQLRANTERGQAHIREADLRLSQLNQVSVREIEAQEARVREIRAQLNQAVLELERFRSLLQSDVISRQQVDLQSSQVDRYRAALEFEDATLHKLRTSADTSRAMAEAQVTTQKTELESVRVSMQLPSLREAVKFAEAELKTSIIRAPANGQIIEIISDPGEAVQGRVILRMGDVSQMYVLAEVYESDASRVRVGASAEVSSSALSKPLAGIVDRVGTSVFKRQVRSLDPQADADARVVQVRIRLDGSEEAAHFVDLQVDVLIDTEK